MKYVKISNYKGKAEKISVEGYIFSGQCDMWDFKVNDHIEDKIERLESVIGQLCQIMADKDILSGDDISKISGHYDELELFEEED